MMRIFPNEFYYTKHLFYSEVNVFDSDIRLLIKMASYVAKCQKQNHFDSVRSFHLSRQVFFNFILVLFCKIVVGRRGGGGKVETWQVSQ